MNKNLYSLLVGGIAAVAGIPATAVAQTPSTGSPYTVTGSSPYTENWKDYKSLLSNDVWTVEDKNEDNYTWDDLDAGAPTYNGANATKTADDWLVSPPLYLVGGQSYTLEAGAYCGAFSGTAQRMAVAFGTGDDPTQYTELIPASPVSGTALAGDPTILKGVFTPATSGNYRIGFHAVSDMAGYIIMHNVKVSETAATAATPVAITDLTLEAGQNGASTVKVSFTAPVKDITDRDLTSLTSATIYRDNSTLPVWTIDSPTPGQKIEWTDTNVEDGSHTYTVYTSVGDLRSAKAEATTYVGGELYPAKPQNVRVYDNLDGTVTIKWDPVTTGENGGYIDPESIQYGIFEGLYSEAIAEAITENECTLDGIPLDGSQGYKIYQVVAYTDEEHQSNLGMAEYFFYGTPYDFPFAESWPYGSWSNGPWAASYNDTKNHFKISSQSADDDEGSVIFTPAKAGDEASFVGPKMALGKATNPRLSFQYYAYPGSKSKLQIFLDVNGQDMKLAAEVDYSTLTGNAGWRTVNVDVADEAFKKENGYGRVFIHAISDGENIIVDDININDAIDYNVITTMTAPLHVQQGDQTEVTVHVRNVGLEEASGFPVKLYANGAVVASTNAGAIASGETRDYVLTFGAPLSTNDLKLKAYADWEDDENPDNNMTEEQIVKVVTSTYPVVTDLRASMEGSSVKLEWSAPKTENQTITESFETYEAFLVDDIAPWTLYDADNCRTASFGGITFPGNGTPYAYMVFNLYGTTHGMDEETTERFKQRFGGRTGDQAMLSFGNLGDAVSGNNDWIISPELSGKAQTVSFYIKAPQCDNANYGSETFYVAYSTTDTQANHFTKVLDDKASDNIEWKQVTVDLPEGAKYFAIVHTSTVPQTAEGYDPASVLVDDVTYESAPLQITGYQVFRGSQLVSTIQNGAETSFIDAEGTDQDKYHVVTIYSNIKSGLSNTASADPTGISNVTASDATVAAGNGCIVVNGNANVYTTSGALVYSGNANGAVTLPAGIYVVKTNGKTSKVVVK